MEATLINNALRDEAAHEGYYQPWAGRCRGKYCATIPGVTYAKDRPRGPQWALMVWAQMGWQ